MYINICLPASCQCPHVHAVLRERVPEPAPGFLAEIRPAQSAKLSTGTYLRDSMAEQHEAQSSSERKSRPKHWEQNGKDGEKGRIRVSIDDWSRNHQGSLRLTDALMLQLKRKRSNGSAVYITLPHGPESDTFPDLRTAEPVLELLDQVLKVNSC